MGCGVKSARRPYRCRATIKQMSKVGFKVSRTFQFDRIVHQLQRVRTWQLVILLLFSLILSATFLRVNNVGMVQRREAVIRADEAGRDGDIADRLYDLQRYVSEHMNTDTGQFDLKDQYRRHVERAIEAAKDVPNPNGNVNVQVDAICRPRFSTWSPAYVQCFADELAKFPPAPNPDENVTLPSPTLYRHSFISPRWSPDFAGYSILVSLALALIILARLAQAALLRILLKLRNKGHW